jgi:hypothetical protein
MSNAMQAIREYISSLRVGAAQHFRNLSLFPLFGPATVLREPDYLLAEAAIASGLARVTEVTSGGSVPELRFENTAHRSVLLLDGEELIGAKQNRVVNLTILVPAKATIVVPVACVEAGRWHMETPDLRPSERIMYSRARAARTAHVAASMRTSGMRRADQGAVWNDIAAKAERLDAASPTGAMSAVYERHALSVESYVRAFSCEPQQIGIGFAINGKALGLDLFDHPATVRALFPKLARSYALDALDTPESHASATPDALAALLAAISRSQSVAEPAIGAGKDVRVTGKCVSGAALWADGRYVHFCAFATPTANGDAGPTTRIARPRQRRLS